MLRPPSTAGFPRGGTLAPPLPRIGSSAASVRVRSTIPGRTRWHVPGLIDNPALARRIDDALRALPGIISVTASSLTGGLLATYEPSVSVSYLTAFLTEIQTIPAPAPPANADSSPRDLPAARPAAKTNDRSLTLTKLISGNPAHERLARQAVLLAMLNRTFDSAPTTLIATAIDVVTRGPGSFLGKLGFSSIRSQLLALSGLGLTIWAVDAALGYYYSTAAADLGSAVQHDLLNQAYEHLQAIDPARVERKSVSDWMTLMDADISHIAEFIEKGVDPVVSMAANSMVAAGTFLAISPRLAAVQLLSIPGLYFVSTRFLKPIKERRTDAREAETALLATLHNNVAGMSTIAASVTQDAEVHRVAEANARFRDAMLQMARLSAGYVPAIKMVVAPGFLIALYSGGRLVEQGLLAPSSYSMMSYSSLRLFAALGRLGVTLDGYQKASVSLYRVGRFLNERPSIVSGDLPLPLERTRGDVTFEDVSFGYSPDKRVIDGLNLHLPAGKTIGIVGPSGAGKTTILRLLLRFYDTEAGRVAIDGNDVRDLRLSDLRRAIAYVPQTVFLTRGTIRENIAYLHPEASLEDVRQAARLAAADEFIEELPDGYETQVGFGGMELSGGQRQRIVIARALLSNAPILLFDEATSAIDHETEAVIQRSLQDVTKGRTTIVVAHRLSTIRQSDLIYVLDDGEVHEQGRHDDLVLADGVYASMWRIQTGEAPHAAEASARFEREPEPASGGASPETAGKAPNDADTRHDEPETIDDIRQDEPETIDIPLAASPDSPAERIEETALETAAPSPDETVSETSPPQPIEVASEAAASSPDETASEVAAPSLDETAVLEAAAPPPIETAREFETPLPEVKDSLTGETSQAGASAPQSSAARKPRPSRARKRSATEETPQAPPTPSERPARKPRARRPKTPPGTET